MQFDYDLFGASWDIGMTGVNISIYKRMGVRPCTKGNYIPKRILLETVENLNTFPELFSH